MEINDYIMPLFRRAGDERSFAGTAFCANGYLVTAAHVLDWNRPCYVRNGNDYNILEHHVWQPRQLRADDRLGFDVAFYPLDGMPCPLSLSDTDAEKGDELDLLCWQFVDGRPRRVATSCIVRGDAEEQGYLRVATAERITHGASGCPVFKDGKVYGMLTMGRDVYMPPEGGFQGISGEFQSLMRRYETNTCWVFKTGHMRRFLHD